MYLSDEFGQIRPIIPIVKTANDLFAMNCTVVIAIFIPILEIV
jgi:hypothetical protein